MTDLVRPVNLKKPIVNRKLIAWVFVITGLLSIVFWAIGKYREGNLGIFKPTVITFDVPKQKLPIVTAKAMGFDKNIVNSLQSEVATQDGLYAIDIYRPNQNQEYGVNQDSFFTAASTMKVPIMIAVLKKIDLGQIKLTDTYSLREEDKRDGSGGIFGMPAGSSLTVDYMLQQMGQNSDNSAPVIFSNMLGGDYIQGIMDTLNMTKSSFSQNTTTAADLIHMWRGIYQGHFLSDDSLKLLENYLSNSIYEDRIPAGVPADTKVIHKVGTEDGVWGDTGVAISADGKTVVYIAIINKNINLDQAKVFVPGLVKDIWNYETKSQNNSQ